MGQREKSLLHTRQLASFFCSQRKAFTLRGKGPWDLSVGTSYDIQTTTAKAFYKSLHMDTKGKIFNLGAFGGHIGLPSSVVFLNYLHSLGIIKTDLCR